jgi:hypothetical protein
MALTEKQGLEAALADINDSIRLTERQIRTIENSRVLTPQQKNAELKSLQAELAVLQGQQGRLITALNQLSLNTSGAADIVRDDQGARVNNSYPAAPAPPAPLVIAADGRVQGRGTTSDSNANKTATTETGAKDGGTNEPVRTLNNTQSIASPAQSGPLPASISRGAFVPGTQNAQAAQITNNGAAGGVGATSDDGAQKPGTELQNRLDNLYGTKNIEARENILDQYPSYTYSLSWYLLDPDTYKTLYTQPGRSLNGFYLLAQSGGANVQNVIATEQGPSIGVGRNPSFPLDYYIDDFYVDFNYPGTPGARGSSVISELGFTVTEPNGITLLRNLYEAIRNLYVTKGVINPGATVNYSSAHFCMVIRFYGYDANGNLVMPIGDDKRVSASDKSAIIEKYIPFNITNVDFTVSNKLVTYTIKCASPGQNHGASLNRGTLPVNFTFNGATVQEMLVGSVQKQVVLATDEGRVASTDRGTRGGA